MRKRIFGFAAAVFCGVAIYITGYAFGEIKGQNTVTQMYTQGYRTGFIKGFRRYQKELQFSENPQLNLPHRTSGLVVDAK